MSTPKSITFIIVIGLCGMACTYMLTMSACILFGINPQSEIMRSFEAAGMYVLGAFTAVLVNTRSQPTETSTLEVHARSNTDSNSNLHPADNASPNTTNPVAEPNTAAKPEPNTLTVPASSTSTTESS